MFFRKQIIELIIFTITASILWFLFNISIATSFLCGASVSYLSNAYAAYMLLVYQAKSIRQEARRFYIAEFGKWSISAIMFALIFLCLEIKEPLVFFGAFIFSNLITIFFTKLKISK